MAGGNIPDVTAPLLEGGQPGFGAGPRQKLTGYTGRMAGSGTASPSETAGRLVPFRVTAEPLDLAQAAAAVASPECGAVATFVGLVRDHNLGRQVHWLDYECYEPLAVSSLERIAAEAATEWPGARLAIAHRIGSLQIGEASVVIAAGSPHRADAFAACRYAIERIKQIVPIWKHEHFEGGDSWIEGATANPDDQQARELALERAGK
jgi:molybdopterin synthase catalytic subunit